MAAVQFFLPYDIAIKPTNTGVPGALLYVYGQGTTTKVSVYASSSLTTQLTNPVVADGAGRLPPIYLDNALSYKIVITDSAGATLYSRDPYIPGQAPDSSALAPYQNAAAASATSAASSATSAVSAASAASTSAGQAANSASAASTSATNAATSESNASNSAAAAAASKTAADADASAAHSDRLAADADAASTATNSAAAAVSAATASSGAATATDRAAAASTSAAAANSSATSAATSASAAAGSAISANTSATAAQTARTGAEAAQSGTLAALAGTSLSNATINAASRVALAALDHTLGLPAYLSEGARQGTFVFDSSNLSSMVTADTAQGVYVAPSSDTTGASGAWVRKFTGPYCLEWFGAVYGANAGANCAANNAAITGLLSLLTAKKFSVSSTKYAMPSCDLGGGILEISQTINPTYPLRMVGRGGGNAFDGAGTIIMPYGCTAIQSDGPYSDFRDFMIYGDFDTYNSEAEYHGIAINQVTFCTRVTVRKMRGDGFHVNGNTSLGHTPDGSSLRDCISYGNRNGTAFGTDASSAGDANVITVDGGYYQGNRQCGHLDRGFLGNSYRATEGAGNGTTSFNTGVGIPASVVFYGIAQGGAVNYFYQVIDGQETWASTNPPTGDGATSNQGWVPWGSGTGAVSGKPAWFSGISLRAGGQVICSNSSAVTGFTDCYSESDQPRSQIMKPSIVRGGQLAKYVASNSTCTVEGIDSNGYKTLSRAIRTLGYSGTDEAIQAGLGEASSATTGKTILYGSASVGASSGHRLKYASSTTGDVFFEYGNLSAARAYYITGPNTADQAGTGAAFPHAFRAMYLLVNGNNNTNTDSARRLMIDTAVPSTGAHGRGEWVFYNGTTAGLLGWKCTAAGTPGTWEAVYSGYSLGAIGYQTGSGGTATQATSKATAVTLNKLTGAITMNAAALAAGAVVSFTLNNSQIAADDELMVRVKSGYATAATYRAWAEGNAAGSRTIVLQNISGGSLSEAVVLGFIIIKGASA